MATLKILSGSRQGEDIDLDLDNNTIGRATANTIAIQDAGVSSKHAKIWAEDGQWWLMDVGSTNGTLVNNADVDREKLNDGDKIAFGPVQCQFVSGARRAAAARPGPVSRAAPQAAPAAPAAGPANAELEIELGMMKARYATLEQEMDKQRQQFQEAEKGIAEHAVRGFKVEMEKLRDLMRERDQSMKTLEAQAKERDAYYSPEELEREKKRVEASIMLDAKRQIEAFERANKELESKFVGRGAEVEALSRTNREKDDLIRLMSDREDRAQNAVKERDDKISEMSASLKKLEEDLTATTSKEREANEKLRQKNQQIADMGQQQAQLQQEISKARASAARVAGGDAGAAQAQMIEITNELDTTRKELMTLRQQLQAARDEVISATSARDLEMSKSGTAQKHLDELQAQFTDLNDEKAKLEARVDELMRNHSQMAELERQLASAKSNAEQSKNAEEAVRSRVHVLETELTNLEKLKLDLVAQRDAAKREVDEMKSDYSVLRGSHDQSLDWEARYKSQVDDFQTLKKRNIEMEATIEALEANAGTAGAGTVDDATLAWAKSRTAMLEEMAGGMLEGVNNAVSLLRRNSEVLKGYVHDCGLLASCVRQINYTLLEPDQQKMLRELIDETQPDVIIRNMEGIGDENEEATKRAKKLILDYMEAMKVDEEGTDLERCVAKSQGLFTAVDAGTQIRVKVGKALPALPLSQPEGVLFAFALLREAKSLALDEDNVPKINIDPEGKTITIMVSPVHARAKDRWREAAAGAGDARSAYIQGFAKQGCKGRIDVKDMGAACTMFITLNAE